MATAAGPAVTDIAGQLAEVLCSSVLRWTGRRPHTAAADLQRCQPVARTPGLHCAAGSPPSRRTASNALTRQGDAAGIAVLPGGRPPAIQPRENAPPIRGQTPAQTSPPPADQARDHLPQQHRRPVASGPPPGSAANSSGSASHVVVQEQQPLALRQAGAIVTRPRTRRRLACQRAASEYCRRPQTGGYVVWVSSVEPSMTTTTS